MSLRLLRSWKDGKAQHAGTLEDYANLAEGLLTLYETTFEERFFVAARELADAILDHFEAPRVAASSTPLTTPRQLFARPRSLQDNAIPSGGAMATTVLLRLAALTGENRYRDAAERALAPDRGHRRPAPDRLRPVAQRLPARQRAHRRDRHRRRPRGRGHQGPARGRTRGLPPGPGRRTSRPTLTASAVPLLRDRAAIDGAATAYLCRGFACQRPTTDPAELARQLEAARSS